MALKLNLTTVQGQGGVFGALKFKYVFMNVCACVYMSARLSGSAG